MTFTSYVEACNFYKQYAQKLGFGTAVRRSTFTTNGECYQLILVCHKWGKGRGSERYQSRVTAKTNCPASIRLKRHADGLLHLEKANTEHNHPLNPSMKRYLKCFKILSSDRVIRPNRFAHTLLRDSGSENLPIDEDELKNSVERGHLKIGPGDNEAMQQFFTRMQKKNSNFFHLVDLDEESRLRSVFWADSRSRIAYEYFSDVVSFDTTHLSNKCSTPLVLFIGVNHHGQPVLLGCGMLSDETIGSYVWLFKAWVACMSGKPPNAIITDHCKAIQDAVSHVFPDVRHRICLWQILRKIPEKLRNFPEHQAVKDALKKVVCDSLTVEEFECEWKKNIEYYGLEGSDWFRLIYDIRHSWVPAFLKDSFWAGMSVTNRTESMGAFFEGLVHKESPFKQFICKYEAALLAKYEKEAQADSESLNKSRHLISKFYMEEQISKQYTLNLFKKFQDELKATMYCDALLVKEEGSISTFEVKESVYMEDGKKTVYKDHQVLYNADDLQVQCICGCFQFKGFLCRHALSVLKSQQIYEIPSHYILNRWKKDCKQLCALARSSVDVELNDSMDRYGYLSQRCHQLIDLGVMSDDKYHLALKLIKEAEECLLDENTGDRRLKFASCATTLSESSGNPSEAHPLDCSKNPNGTPGKRRGRPPKKRKESEMETTVVANQEMHSLRTSLVGEPSDMVRCAPTHIGSHIGIQGGINLMEEISRNDLSFGSHFGVPINHQHHIDAQSRVQHNNILQGQFNQEPLGNQSRMHWFYHDMLQEDQIPRLPHGRRPGQ
ncbi:protein FAR1-RELATED SEQUENCE 6-like [Dioscorea cayenensis subsp. rotundata]|uniref:Protein FAR1-RELATED SEQUENCE n=1 Tax=Dioscorea cayennensis subsp. rotundata TaxID=55577 RepID=A0AB40B521_DIOCR|nr:protein FAR1-RELATED SEQUENCE 6-like [Dioscorea cayenensis subsp. rotundata]